MTGNGEFDLICKPYRLNLRCCHVPRETSVFLKTVRAHDTRASTVHSFVCRVCLLSFQTLLRFAEKRLGAMVVLSLAHVQLVENLERGCLMS